MNIDSPPFTLFNDEVEVFNAAQAASWRGIVFRLAEEAAGRGNANPGHAAKVEALSDLTSGSRVLSLEVERISYGTVRDLRAQKSVASLAQG